jgi:uncharacterized membrane protein
MTTFLRNFALFNFFGLMITLICWITLAEHGEYFPTAAFLVLALVPLLFPLRGLLHGKPYTHAWTSFLMLLYFSHGVGEFYSADSPLFYPALEIIFSTLAFMSSISFIKLNAKMRKNSQS